MYIMPFLYNDIHIYIYTYTCIISGFHGFQWRCQSNIRLNYEIYLDVLEYDGCVTEHAL